MAFLDTSVLVRYFTGEPAHMAEAAIDIIEGVDDLVINPLVLAEAGYALTSSHRIPREHVVDHLVALLGNDNISVWQLDKALVIEALMKCRPSGRVSFADALLWADARAAGAPVYSFDERFPDEGIEVLRSASA